MSVARSRSRRLSSGVNAVFFLCPLPASFQHTAHRRFGNKTVFHGHGEDAPQVDQDLRLQGVAFARKTRHKCLNLHGADVLKPVIAEQRQNLMVEYIPNRILVLFTEIGLFVDIEPHLHKMAEGFLAANVHSGLDHNLNLQDFLVQFLPCLSPNVLPCPVRQEDGSCEIGILLFGFGSHLAFSLSQYKDLQKMPINCYRFAKGGLDDVLQTLWGGSY